MSQIDQNPIKVAVVGCGAVTEQFHLPVLAGHQGVTIAALVDPDSARVSRLASLYQVPRTFASAESLDRGVADAAIVATPPYLHAEGAMALMRRGLHVLVEKPMALTSTDGERMVAVAREQGAEGGGVALHVGREQLGVGALVGGRGHGWVTRRPC